MKLSTLFILIGIILAAPTAQAETWLCKQKDGTEIFSNTGSGTECKKYEPTSELGRIPGGVMSQPDRDRASGEQPRMRSLKSDQDRQVRQPGEITFQQFRMLARGLTEGQVLSKLGSPISRTVLSCTLQNRTVVCPERWTYTMPDGWTADLTFIAGQLSEYNNSRP